MQKLMLYARMKCEDVAIGVIFMKQKVKLYKSAYNMILTLCVMLWLRLKLRYTEHVKVKMIGQILKKLNI